ncbi:MAG TPA: class I SAM-dependent methyltransferase [Thermoanaerobaculia bacterium]|jgi:SAM-dependent methyltransferase
MASIARSTIRAGRFRRVVWTGWAATHDHWQSNWTQQDIARMIAGTRSDFEVLPVLRREIPAGARVLEAGCGLGQWVIVLRELGIKAFGVDYVADALRTSVRHRSAPSVVTCGDINRLPFADGTFEAITSFGVVEHFWRGPAALIAEMVRVLAPGGTMFLSVPYFNALRKMTLARAPQSVYDADEEPAAFYQFAFERQEIAEAVEKAGLVITDSFGVGPVKGWKDEIGLFAALRGRLNQSTAPSSLEAPAAAQVPRSGGGSRGGLSLARTLRRTLQVLANTRLSAAVAGHMIMLVCKKPEGAV